VYWWCVTANTLLPLLLGVGCALLGGVVLAVPQLRRSRLPAILILLLPLLLAAVWWHQLPTQEEDRPAETAIRDSPRIELRLGTMTNIVTDRGRPVSLGQVNRTATLAALTEHENDNIRVHDLARKVIVRTKPDPSSNCHGWVFAEGRYWVNQIEVILADNGYLPVSAPAIGDLAIYRGIRGDIVHSGLVRTTAGGILVESKWGPMGRYLHGPDDQPFGGLCAFYRSARRGHLLAGLSLEGERADRRDGSKGQ